MSGDSALVLMQAILVTGDAGAVSELAALCVKGKPANMHQDYTSLRTNGTGKHTCTDIVLHIPHMCNMYTEHTMEVETYRAQALRNG